jgi:hypothetical protein
MGKHKYFYAPIWTTGKSLEQGPHRDYYTEEIEGLTDWHVRVYMQRLILELFAVSLITGVIFILVSKRNRKEEGISQPF